MKKFLRFLFISIPILLLFGFLFWQYLLFDFNKSFDQNQLNQLKDEIKKSEPLSDDFIATYDEIHPITNINGITFDQLIENHKRKCPCLILARQIRIPVRKRFNANYYILSSKLEKEFTQEECLSFLASEIDFLYENKGIKKASSYYFNKEMNSLNKEELQALIFMMENPILYNPKRNPNAVKERLAEINN